MAVGKEKGRGHGWPVGLRGRVGSMPVGRCSGDARGASRELSTKEWSGHGRPDGLHGRVGSVSVGRCSGDERDSSGEL